MVRKHGFVRGFEMDLLTNATPEEAFGLATEYFEDTYMKVGRSARIVSPKSPSRMDVEFGSWFAAMGNPRGTAKVRIAKKDELTSLSLDFGFKKEYRKSLFFSGAILIFICGYFLWQALTLPVSLTDEPIGGLATALFFGFFIFAVLFMITAVNVSLTRGKLLRDFAAFLQEATSKEEQPQSPSA
jgi:hypothetical protein